MIKNERDQEYESWKIILFFWLNIQVPMFKLKWLLLSWKEFFSLIIGNQVDN